MFCSYFKLLFERNHQAIISIFELWTVSRQRINLPSINYHYWFSILREHILKIYVSGAMFTKRQLPTANCSLNFFFFFWKFINLKCQKMDDVFFKISVFSILFAFFRPSTRSSPNPKLGQTMSLLLSLIQMAKLILAFGLTHLRSGSSIVISLPKISLITHSNFVNQKNSIIARCFFSR